ncbi:mitochondrial proton/calcium exchanger protein-like [Limulus polyphemus]|uniref:Mitochondrial proton/calcium exchanger protein n=1 Tax=Limulus polyphemus TaxID=6850 RepID=A0ABM1THI6_LIMPO|nr:mitochondrial proton/calcium exchanger protein-like [Limulus polyphemus]
MLRSVLIFKLQYPHHGPYLTYRYLVLIPHIHSHLPRSAFSSYFVRKCFSSEQIKNNQLPAAFYSSTYLKQYDHNIFKPRTKLIRSLHSGNILYEKKEYSKVEKTVKALKEEAEKGKQDIKQKVTDLQATPKPVLVVPPKRSLWKRIWDEILHYYHGFRLFFIDVKISSRLVWKVLHADNLTRREHRQLVRTVSDVFRILPFSVFIIVPFMEVLLPVVIKLFPGMLPSTFQTSSEKEMKVKKQLKVKLEMAKFLRETMEEMSVQARGDKHSHTAKEFAQFFEKVRQSAEQPTNEEIMKFSKLFEDEITLDSLSRPQLIALCRLLELQPLGTNNFLRFQLKMKLRTLHADDQMIKNEGIGHLTVPELQAACRSRGMRAFGVPEARLRSQLSQWLELSLNEKIPPSLLLLSRVLYLPESLPASDQLKATLSALPQEAATEAKYKIGETEGKVDNKTKIEVIRKEEVAIRKESEERKKEKEKEEQAAAAVAKGTVKELAEEGTPYVDSVDVQGIQGLPEEAVVSPKLSISDILQDSALPLEDKADELDRVEQSIIEQLKEEELSKEDFSSLQDALENIASEKKKLLLEKEGLEELKEGMAEYKEDIEEFKEALLESGDSKLQESKAAKHLYNKVNKMVVKMSAVLNELDKEKKVLQEQIETLAQKGEDVDLKTDNIISISDLICAIQRIQKISDDTRLQRIADVLDQMDVDHDGAVELDHVLKVIELLGNQDVKVSVKQMKEIIELLAKEETLELVKKVEKEQVRLHSQSPEKASTNHGETFGKEVEKRSKEVEEQK